jgi:hypothetical protein
MCMPTAANCWGKRIRRTPWRGVTLFALGVIGLSYVELGLFVRIPHSKRADHFALASDLTPVLCERMHDASAKGSDSPDKRSLISVTSSADTDQCTRR